MTGRPRRVSSHALSRQPLLIGEQSQAPSFASTATDPACPICECPAATPACQVLGEAGTRLPSAGPGVEERGPFPAQLAGGGGGESSWESSAPE